MSLTVNIDCSYSSDEDLPQSRKRKPVLCLEKLLTEALSIQAFSDLEAAQVGSKPRRKRKLLSRHKRTRLRTYPVVPYCKSTDTEEDTRVRSLYRKFGAKLHSLPYHQARNIEWWCIKSPPEVVHDFTFRPSQVQEQLFADWKSHFQIPQSARKHWKRSELLVHGQQEDSDISQIFSTESW